MGQNVEHVHWYVFRWAMGKSSPEILVSDPSPSFVIVGSHAWRVIGTGLRKVIVTPIRTVAVRVNQWMLHMLETVYLHPYQKSSSKQQVKTIHTVCASTWASQNVCCLENSN